jgi:hypothetical protein
LEEKEANAMPSNVLKEKDPMSVPVSMPKKQRKKFIPKEPFVLQNLENQLPELIKASPVLFIDAQWMKKDPFEGYLQAVFAHLQERDRDETAKAAKLSFTTSLLPSLIKARRVY